MYARSHYILLLFVLIVISSCQEKKANFFEREAREYTQAYCPEKYPNGVTLDSVVFIPNDSTVGDLQFHYSLQLDDEQRTTIMNSLGEIGDMSLKDVRNSIRYAKHKEAGVSFTYIYIDATKGDKIVEYHITKEDYQ